jgi:hypothetical protein
VSAAVLDLLGRAGFVPAEPKEQPEQGPHRADPRLPVRAVADVRPALQSPDVTNYAIEAFASTVLREGRAGGVAYHALQPVQPRRRPGAAAAG